MMFSMFFETQSCYVGWHWAHYIIPNDLELVIICLSLLSPGETGLCHHAQLMLSILIVFIGYLWIFFDGVFLQTFYFLKTVLSALLLMCKSPLYTLDTSPLLTMYIANIFSQSMASLFYLFLNYNRLIVRGDS
jgi:hypothetical protein